MSHQMQHPYISSISQMPAKRRRGRPRKNDEPVVQYSLQTPPMVPLATAVSPATPVPLSYVDKGKKPVEADQGEDGNNVGDGIVGRAVTGVVESAFDAGYLIAMKVGDTYMRGVIFQPDKIVPITKENDVAPNVKFYTKNQLSTDDNQDVQNRVDARETGPSQPAALQKNLEELNEDLTVEFHEPDSVHVDKRNPRVDVDESLVEKDGEEIYPNGGQNEADYEVIMDPINQENAMLKGSNSLAGNGGDSANNESRLSNVARDELNEKVPCSRTEEAMEIADEQLTNAMNEDETTNTDSEAMNGITDPIVEDKSAEVSVHKDVV